MGRFKINDGLTKSQRYALRHPDRLKKTQSKYRNGHKVERNASKRNWAKANAQHAKNYQKEWYARQPEKIWKRWPSRKPPKNRKPGRTKAEILRDNRALHHRRTRNLHDSYLVQATKSRTSYEPTAENIKRLRDQIAAKRFRRVAKQIAAANIIASALP